MPDLSKMFPSHFESSSDDALGALSPEEIELVSRLRSRKAESEKTKTMLSRPDSETPITNEEAGRLAELSLKMGAEGILSNSEHDEYDRLRAKVSEGSEGSLSIGAAKMMQGQRYNSRGNPE